MFLHEKIKRQCENCVVFILRTVACHKQKQQHHQQIPGVKILRKQLPEKTIHRRMLHCSRWFSWRFRSGLRRCDWWTRFMNRCRLWRPWRQLRFTNAVAPERAVRLGNVSVIHGFHLPDWDRPVKIPAMEAIFAARMARSNLPIRDELKYGRSAPMRFC